MNGKKIIMLENGLNERNDKGGKKIGQERDLDRRKSNKSENITGRGKEHGLGNYK